MSRSPESHLARFLKHEAKSLKLKTSVELAREVGIATSRMDGILDDRTRPSRDEAEKISRFLGPETWKLVNALIQQEADEVSGKPVIARGSERRRIRHPTSAAPAARVQEPPPANSHLDEIQEMIDAFDEELSFIQKHCDGMRRRLATFREQAHRLIAEQGGKIKTSLSHTHTRVSTRSRTHARR